MNEFLTREDLTAADPRRYDTFNVPMVKGANGKPKRCRIRNLNELERSTYEAAYMGENLTATKRGLVVACVVHPVTHEPILTTADVDALAEKDGLLIAFLYSKCKSHCGYTDADIDELVGKLSSGSEVNRSDSSPLDSPPTAAA